MKRTVAVVTSLVATGALPASAALIAGWETWSEASADTWNPTQFGTGITAVADGTPESGGSWFNFSNTTVANGASNDGSWGTVTVPAADATTESSTDGVALSNGYDGFIDFTVTNGSGAPIDLDSFNFDSGAFRARAATDWELSVVAGSITVGSVAAGGPVTVASAPIVDDYDVPLTGLADRQLDSGASAIFRLSFTGGGAPETASSGHHLFLDNVAVFGTVVPEPSVVPLAALALALGLRRRSR